MEMQYFVRPDTDEEWFEFWKEKRMQWYHDIGIKKEKLRFHEHSPDELAHYARKAFDIEYEFPFGWKELEGIHNRTDFDLSRHQEYSGNNMSYFDQEQDTRYIPFIIETSAGVDRTLLTCLVDAYDVENPGTKQERKVLRFSPKIAPIKAAILPLVNRDGMPEIARRIADELRPHLKVFYDDGGSVGRRYRRQDEAGTPFGITVDSQTLEDETITLRERDSMEQVRLKIAALKQELLERTAM
jgi:glycyl-tRNA synthetase